MGILNTTPDSFSDGGSFPDQDAAIAHARAMVAAGADMIDVGGASSRPGSEPVPAALEIDRTRSVVARLVGDGVIVSIDTAQVEVAAAALDAGAHVVNDISGMADPEMRRLVASQGAGAVVMHMQGEPSTMQDEPSYDDVVEEVAGFLGGRVAEVIASGVDRASIVVDPGIGFGKNTEHNLLLLKHLDRIAEVGPVLVGTSRKGFLGRLTGRTDPTDRDVATAATTAVAVASGAVAVRVHDVGRNLEAARVSWAIVRASGADWGPVSMERGQQT